MGYKISLTLEVLTKQQRDDLLKDIRGLLLQQPVTTKGKLKQSISMDVQGNDYISLFPFGAEPAPSLPIDQAIADEAPVTPPAEPATEDDGDEPPSAFDKLLGRERPPEDEE